MQKKHVISNNNVTVLKAKEKGALADVILLQNEVSHSVRQSNVIFTLERRCKYM